MTLNTETPSCVKATKAAGMSVNLWTRVRRMLRKVYTFCASSNFANLSPVVPWVCRRWSRWRLAMPSWRRCSICHWAGQWHICLLIWAGNWHSWDCLRWTPQPISHCLVMLAYLKGSDAYLCCGLISFASYFKMTPQSEGIDQKQELQMEPTHQCLRCCKWKVVGHIVN